MRVIECLKASELEIKDIKKFMEWCVEGPSTYAKKKELFETRKAAVEKEMGELQKMQDLLKYKCWYYETAIRDENEDRINRILPDDLPPAIQALYNNGHK